MRVDEDIVTIAELRNDAARVARQLHETGRPVIVTQRGKPAMVLLTPAEYDRLVYERELVTGISQALAEADAGQLLPHSAVMSDVREAVERQAPAVAAARRARAALEGQDD